MFNILEMPPPTLNSLLPVRLQSWLGRLGTTTTTATTEAETDQDKDKDGNKNKNKNTMAPPALPYAPRAQLLVVLVAVIATVLALVSGEKRSTGDDSEPRLGGRQAAAPAPAPATCVSASAPNTISAKFPNSATGVLNGSLVVVPIPMADARRAVPPQWGILEGAMRANLPDFPQGMYPLFIQAVQDHDIKMHAFNVSIPDFTRVSLEFPFIDLLNDGYSSFRWAPVMLLSSSNQLAIKGSADYGTKAVPATFTPECDGYQAVASSCSSSAESVPGTTTFTATASDSSSSFSLTVSPDPAPPISLPVGFFVNATNQPTFANGTACSNMIRLFDQSLFANGAGREPRAVAGKVAAVGMGPGLLSWTKDDAPREAFGIQVATPFAENNYIDCKTLQGYTGAK
ncbi:hypothetical protein MAPG_09912 [Magnaporthiopsis poae ATCC 64411]|uniref:Uncharacterized protein n=1 Tax=Magnaporthiopsis poae (strain ATCC 64411 / 73-15) TaxID=644358 RepID=A0A0C4EB66_MAGP6|nr:hypothetical protein MAPG_09912 [Magnaporthiopsis poae ATCC 64411]